LIDAVVAEPEGGAHSDHTAMAQCLGATIESQLAELASTPIDNLLRCRYDKFRAMGEFAE